ncbi:MAG: type 2 isopentenyl-diphosphate Delta-isomerase [Lewinellaceae bacterium]|nr:isopentenyl-diphosphate delta-isomerase [Saprospiraceae bacterium]MCB9344040.1 type 2 isopentenyl-diphosphate Delta-isomerase [Lewinellaceae bacterium]
MAAEKKNQPGTPEDPTAADRKQDHIELAFKSRVEDSFLDKRFYYEPLFSPHPTPGQIKPIAFLGKTLRYPIWVSSMTGGTSQATNINHRLARACAEFGLGMGLGSCRQLLYSDEHLPDFDLREVIGNDQPFFANLGLAQVEKLLEKKEVGRMSQMVEKLRANGLIIHVNPLQEAMQPEGDNFKRPALEIIEETLHIVDFQIIVKEVGQGFGPESLRALLKLPLAAIEFAAAGGTNFSKLELLRSDPDRQLLFEKISTLGHSAAEMLDWTNKAVSEPGTQIQTKNLIISGGIKDFLDGYYYTQKSTLPAVYGQASGFLKHAQHDYESLQQYIRSQIYGYELSCAFLKVRE